MNKIFTKSFESYTFLKELLEYNNIQEVHDKLNGFLAKIVKESKLNMIYPQVLIVDDIFRITDLYFLPFNNQSPEDKTKFDRYRVSLLGYGLNNNEDLSFYKKILCKIKESESDFLFFLCTGKNNHKNETKEFLCDNYIINEIDPGNNLNTLTNSNSKEWVSEIVFASGENAKFLIEKDVEKYLEFFCVVLIKWPGNRITKKQMYGICGFLFDPKIVESENVEKQFALFNTFNKYQDEIQQLTDSIQTTLYLTQVFAMYQAAIDNPFKLTEYLISYAKIENLKELQQNRISQGDFVQILIIPSVLAIRKIFRDLNELDVENSSVALKSGSLILNALFDKNIQNELNILLQKYIPPILNINQNSYWNYIHYSLINNTLKNIHCFYKKESMETNDFIENTILETAQYAISENFNDLFERNNELKQAFLKMSFFDLLLRTIEDTFEYLDHNLWGKMIIFFEKMIHNERYINVFNYEKTIESLFLALHYSKDNEHWSLLVQLLCFNINKYHPSKNIFRFAQRQFSFLSNEIQSLIIQEISKFSNPNIDNIKEQLSQQFNYQKDISIQLNDSNTYINSDQLQIFNVLSTKGGVGKTMVSLSLASRLAPLRSGKKVCVVDLDFFGPTLTYFMEFKKDSFSLNDYIWNSFLLDNKKEIEENETVQKWIDDIFKYHSFWKERFDSLDFTQNKISNNEDNKITQEIYILPACHIKEVQDLMTPLITYKWAMKKLGSLISSLIITLKNQGFNYIVFDCPAELKDLSIVASKHSIYSKAKNIFVSTLAENCLVPTINTMCEDYYVRTVNYLVLNKVQQADSKLINSKLALIDYYSSLEMDNSSIPTASIAQRKLFFNFKNLDIMTWNESLENIFNIRHDDLKDVLDIVKEKTNDSLINILD